MYLQGCCVYSFTCRWQKIFKWNIWSAMSPYWNKFFFAMILILIVLFLGRYSLLLQNNDVYDVYWYVYSHLSAVNAFRPFQFPLSL